MTEQESFEDRFDHDPNAVYEDEEDEDLGPDDEFADATPYQKPPRRLEPPKGGCTGGLFKIILSLSLISFFFIYIFQSEKLSNVQTKLTSLFAIEKDSEAPVLSLNGTNRSAEKTETLPDSKPDTPVPQIILNGSGSLPDFETSAKRRPSLNSHLISADKVTFETLDTHHELVKNMIADWTGTADEQKIAEIVQMPYKQFFSKTSASLLSQTLLKNIGLTPENSDQMLEQSPIRTMVVVYPLLKEAMALKTTVPEQIRILEPVSSFLIYVCHNDRECMASWDLLIDMLGAKQFSKRLEKAPETIYMRK